MNYKKLALLQQKTKVSNNEIAAAIEMTGEGYAKMMKLETCTVKTLEKLSEYYKVSLNYFFDEYSATEPVLEPPEQYHINKGCAMCEEKEKMIEVLNQRIADKDEMIDLLKGKQGLANCG